LSLSQACASSWLLNTTWTGSIIDTNSSSIIRSTITTCGGSSTSTIKALAISWRPRAFRTWSSFTILLLTSTIACSRKTHTSFSLIVDYAASDIRLTFRINCIGLWSCKTILYHTCCPSPSTKLICFIDLAVGFYW